jgi:hypothetical protein
MPINYQVRQGDCIYSIAFEHGFFADTIWNHPNNAELKKKRKDPNVLMPGDVVFVPDKRVKEVSEATNEVHKYRCKNTPKTFRLQFKRFGRPIPNLEYTIKIDGREIQGKTDSEGWLRQHIPPNARKGVVTMADGQHFDLNLGHLDPVGEVSGIQGRLQTLGYYEGSVNGRMDEATTEALKVFQNSNGLNVTGEADEQTKSRLQELTGK